MHCEYSWFQEVKDCRVLSKNQAQEINFLEIKKHINVFAQFKNARILLISPNLNDYFFWKRNLPSAKFTISTIKSWNITSDFGISLLSKYSIFNDGAEEVYFDLCIAQNVFMYLSKPELAFLHISQISNNLYIQDLKFRIRSTLTTGLGRDGDFSRYAIFGSEPIYTLPVHTISELIQNGEIVFQEEFEGDLNVFHTLERPPIHVHALIRFKNRATLGKFSRIFSFFSIAQLFATTVGSYVKAKFRLLLVRR